MYPAHPTTATTPPLIRDFIASVFGVGYVPLNVEEQAVLAEPSVKYVDINGADAGLYIFPSMYLNSCVQFEYRVTSVSNESSILELLAGFGPAIPTSNGEKPQLVPRLVLLPNQFATVVASHPYTYVTFVSPTAPYPVLLYATSAQETLSGPYPDG